MSETLAKIQAKGVSQQGWTESPLWLVVLVLVIAGGLGARLWIAFAYEGYFAPDEVFQSLEPAHYLAFGDGYLPWEYREGARTWVLPGLLAGVMKICSFVSDRPQVYLGTISVGMCLLAAWSGFLVAYLVRCRQGSLMGATIGGALFSLGSMTVFLGPRPLSENVSVALVTLGVLLALASEDIVSQDKQRARLWVVLASVCVGLSVWLRLQNGLFCVWMLIFLVSNPKLRGVGLKPAVVSFAACGLGLGLFDWLTWGSLFHSAREYIQFNLVDGQASKMFGDSDFTFYVQTMWTANGPIFVVSCVLAVCGVFLPRQKQLAGLPLLVCLFVGTHSLIGHKELRFLLPVLPAFYALSGLGLAALGSRLSRWGGLICVVAVVGVGLWSLQGLPHRSSSDFGERLRKGLIEEPLLDRKGPEVRVLWYVRELPDVVGVRFLDRDEFGTGGLSHWHRPEPLIASFSERYNFPDAPYNYMVLRTLMKKGSHLRTWELIHEDTGVFLYRRRDKKARTP